MTPTPTNRMATLLGSWLVLEGVWGLFNPFVLGFIMTNRLRAGIHLALGVVGLVTAFRDRGSRTFLWVFGLIALTVGILYFIPAGAHVTELLAVNRPAAIINLAIG